MARITLRLPENMHARLVAAAQRRGTSINQVIVESLDDALHLETDAEPDTQSIRAALGDLVANPGDLLAGLTKPEVQLLSHDELRRRMPILTPSLSDAIIADREDRV